ncbi:kynureninase [Talaromyces stipitatus ATCC 10500]|uniref:Kynureninase n=1 Tax=Talaromyces stipitatus (strain ATCC 10500 / CBS 375.48 / QM 6759 / NRRL 1006) TaxID=441959 RepID=B8M8K3_TALSN|nr:kynureninase [Talaromyces stipitatus ATCC 10500]EED20516.1 kynureninase [Talaromyces stipitatus ATCC 10500]
MGSRLHFQRIKEGPPLPHNDDIRAYKREYAEALDEQDPLKSYRDQFIIPSKKDLLRKRLSDIEGDDESDPRCIYLCGNSLGLQPKNLRKYLDQYLRSWAIKGVTGHFVAHEDALLPPYLHVDDEGSKLLAPIVGASPSEVAVMGTLTGNIHILMSSFYRPTVERHKIILEGKAFPSDHYAIESQIRLHNFDPATSMVLIEPEDAEKPILSTKQILKVIDDNASDTMLILLPGIQFYTGQYFDIKTITAHAHSKGVLIGWDCAHAVGNVELQLHDWEVDFAAWCHYKYVNSGPGAMAGLFVHEKHGKVNHSDTGDISYRPRLAGWWGHDKQTRFQMDNKFIPQEGAAGYQISNPSVLDLSAVASSLEIFNQATMPALRQKSLELTRYLEHLLLKYPLDDSSSSSNENTSEKPYTIITPSNPSERGAQLSILLQPGLLDKVLEILEENGVVIDERKPNVVRVAPVPLYNTFTDVWEFHRVFTLACRKAVKARDGK